MAKKKGGLGTGLGALIPNAANHSNLQSDFKLEKPLKNSSAKTSSNHNSIQKGVDVVFGGVDQNSKKSPNKSSTAIKFGEPHIKQDLQTIEGVEFKAIELSQIIANRKNPREVFDEEELSLLANNIKEYGVLQPIRVRPLFKDDEEYINGKRYEIIAGERRFRASEIAKLNQIPAIVADVKNDDVLSEALIENLHRVDLNPLEEAIAYDQLIKDFNMTQQQLSDKLAVPRSNIANSLRLLNAPESVQNKIASGVLSFGHAKAILGIKDAKVMTDLANKIINEGLSVRSTEEEVAIINLGQNKVKSPTKKTHSSAQAQSIELASRYASVIADYLDTVVDVRLAKNERGQLIIQFADLPDLKRITGLFPKD